MIYFCSNIHNPYLLIYIALRHIITGNLHIFVINCSCIFVISGLIIGAIITYTSSPEEKTRQEVSLPDNTSFGPHNPPDMLLLQANNKTRFKYNYVERINPRKVDEENKELEEKVLYIYFKHLVLLFSKQ